MNKQYLIITIVTIGWMIGYLSLKLSGPGLSSKHTERPTKKAVIQVGDKLFKIIEGVTTCNEIREKFGGPLSTWKDEKGIEFWSYDYKKTEDWEINAPNIGKTDFVLGFMDNKVVINGLFNMTLPLTLHSL